MTSIILVQNGLRSSPRKSISNSTDWCRRHKNMTNVSLSRCVSFYSGQSRAKDSSIFIHWNPDFLAFSGEELTNEQGYLGSLCASLFRLHNTVVSPQLRLMCFQSFFKNNTDFEDSKASLTTPQTKEQVLKFSNWKIA